MWQGVLQLQLHGLMQGLKLLILKCVTAGTC